MNLTRTHRHHLLRILAASVAATAVIGPFSRTARAGDGESFEDIHPREPAKTHQSDGSATPAPEAPAPLWDVGVFGYVRAGLDYVGRDPNYDFIGRNSGFILDAARIGVEAWSARYHVSARISAEGASDLQSGINTPLGSLEVRLRDAFGRYDPFPWLGVQLGQYKAPFDAEELRGTQDLLFASRAIAQTGVLPGRGFQEDGMAVDRQLGLMISPAKPIYFGDFGFAYYAMLMNGNGQNQLLNDNNRFGVVGRLEALYAKHVVLGGGILRNDRTIGTPPNLYNEEDLALDADLSVRIEGLEVFGQIVNWRTSFPTVGATDRVRVGYHAQIGYRFENFIIPFEPAYRYAHFDPWASGGDSTTGQDYSAFKIDAHTFGIKMWHPKIPITAWFNYTVTVEPPARRLDNDHVEILAQVTF